MKLRTFFFSSYKPYKILVFLFFLLASFLGLHGLLNSYFLKNIIDTLVQQEGNVLQFRKILWPGLAIVLNFELHSMGWRAINLIRLKVAPDVKNRVTNLVFQYVHDHSLRFFQDNMSGTITNNISTLSENMERIASVLSVRIIKGIVQLLVALVAMSFISPLFSIALLTWVTCFSTISWIFSKRSRLLSNDYAKSVSRVSGVIVDSISNFQDVKNFSQLKKETSLLGNALSLMKQNFQKKEWFLIKFYFFQGLSITLFIASILLILVKLKTSNQITIGDFSFILGACFLVTETVWGVTEQIDQVNDAIGRCDHSLRAIFKKIEVRDPEKPKPFFIEKGGIVFRNVQFHYRKGEPLFDDLSIEIIPGQKVGIVGYSGSGKSTFVNLILRHFDVVSGSITIGGQNIQNVSQESLRKAIGVISQDPSLFHRPLLENLRYGNLNASFEDVVDAAEKANIHLLISGLADGYQTFVGERGVKFSRGERQRIAIARVILKDAPILFMDEATSHLDSITEKTIQTTLNKFMKGKTTLVIAHRLSTLLQMDRILVFEGGKIIEDGTHKKLLERGKAYKTLWDTQVGEFLPIQKTSFV